MKNNDGFSLVEVMVSSGIAVFFIVLVAGAFIQISDSLNRRKITLSRDTVALSTRKNLIAMSVLRATLKKPVNKLFYDCVCASGVQCQNMVKTDLILFETATDLAPANFNSQGSSCLATSPSCMIQVTFKVAAQCPPAPPFPSSDPYPSLTCNGPAEFVMIEYTVGKNPVVTDPKLDFRTVTGKVYLQTSQISPAGAGVCP